MNFEFTVEEFGEFFWDFWETVVAMTLNLHMLVRLIKLHVLLLIPSVCDLHCLTLMLVFKLSVL